MAGWIKMPVGRVVGLSPSEIVLDTDAAPPPSKRPQFAAHVYCGQTARRRCLDGDPAPLPKRCTAQFSTHVYCGQMAGWTKMPPGMEVDLSRGHIMSDEDPAPSRERGTAAPPPFSPHVHCGHSCPSQLLLSSCTNGRPKRLNNDEF